LGSASTIEDRGTQGFPGSFVLHSQVAGSSLGSA
jgi:hypothetical protein